jgi:NADPH2:quinone reductase
MRKQWDELLPMVESGVVDPPVGTTYPVEDVAAALAEMDERRTRGKSVLRLVSG